MHVKDFLVVIDSAVVFSRPVHYEVPGKIFFLRFDSVRGRPRPGNSYGTWDLAFRVVCRRPEVDQNSTSGMAAVGVSEFRGPISTEPLESERPYGVVCLFV